MNREGTAQNIVGRTCRMRLQQIHDVSRVGHESQGGPADETMALHADTAVDVKER